MFKKLNQTKFEIEIEIAIELNQIKMKNASKPKKNIRISVDEISKIEAIVRLPKCSSNFI